MKLLQAKLCSSSSSWKTNLQIQPPPSAEYFDVRLVASEFHMAYQPSSLLSGSCAAVQLSNSSKTDRLPQPVLQIAAAVPFSLSGCLSVGFGNMSTRAGSGWQVGSRAHQIIPAVTLLVWSQRKLPGQSSLRAAGQILKLWFFLLLEETFPNFKMKELTFSDIKL